MPDLSILQRNLRHFSNSSRALLCRRFFKTQPGQYGEGDEFLGISVPQVRSIAKKHRQASPKDIDILIMSPYHEERLLGLIILVSQFQSATDDKDKKRIFDSYVAYLKQGRINNWDLVDVTAHHIIGAYLYDHPNNLLQNTAISSSLWERRVAIVSTLFFIRKKQSEKTLAIAQVLLHDKHDLIHKAVGWMLREVGKYCSEDVLEAFLQENARYQTMPRTMLRYAIERLSPARRQAYLKGKI